MGKLFSKSKSKDTKYGDMSRAASTPSTTSDIGQGTSTKSSRKYASVHDGTVTCVAAVEPEFCLSGGQDCKLVLSNCSTGEVLHTWHGHEKDITKAVYGKRTSSYLSASRDKTAHMYRAGEVAPVQTFVGHDLVVTGLALNTDNTQLCTGSRDNSICIWDVASGQRVRKTSLAQNLITHVTWGRQSEIIAQSGEDKEVRIWDPRSLSVVLNFARKQYIQTCCDLSDDDQYCLTSSNGFGGNGCEATLWDVRTGRLLREFTGHRETVGACCFVPSSVSGHRSLVVTSSNDCTVRVWDRDTSDCLAAITIAGSGPLTSIAAFQDGKICVSSFNVGIQVLFLEASTDGAVDLRRVAQL